MKKLLYLCLFPFLGISCMEDLGTYDYNPLHEITIDTLKNRTIEIYHQLEVEAKISFSGKETPLEYCWYRYTNKIGLQRQFIGWKLHHLPKGNG